MPSSDVNSARQLCVLRRVPDLPRIHHGTSQRFVATNPVCQAGSLLQQAMPWGPSGRPACGCDRSFGVVPSSGLAGPVSAVWGCPPSRVTLRRVRRLHGPPSDGKLFIQAAAYSYHSIIPFQRHVFIASRGTALRHGCPSQHRGPRVPQNGGVYQGARPRQGGYRLYEPQSRRMRPHRCSCALPNGLDGFARCVCRGAAARAQPRARPPLHLPAPTNDSQCESQSSCAALSQWAKPILVP